jgi:hypothetical protein
VKEGALWLNQALVDGILGDGAVPWGSGISRDVFDQHFTLHDSYWLGAFTELGWENACVLAFKWDACWLPEGPFKEASVRRTGPMSWSDADPYLLTRITRVTSLSMEGFEDIGGVQRGVANHAFSCVDGATRLEITDPYGATVSIVFSGSATFLPLDADGRAIDLSRLKGS